MIVDKELVVSNRSRAEIIQDLKAHKFRPFSEGSVANTAEEANDVLVMKDNEDDYGYLMGMTILTLTREKVSLPDALLIPLN